MPKPSTLLPLPCSWEECIARGWNTIDILLVTGDSYVDHPSFGISLIGHLLMHHGYRVAILAQPHFANNADFASFPEPLLFCGITGGNLDSIVANYSGNGKVRDYDAYSTEGKPWRGNEKGKGQRKRPDRATTIYANLARSAFKNTKIILGGIEASLRRFIHFDYKQNKLRGSVLTDSKADLLIYGMGEKAVLEVASRLSLNKTLHNIPGTCIRLSDREFEDFKSTNLTEPEQLISLPSHTIICQDQSLFLQAEKIIDKKSRQVDSSILVQKQQASWVMQFPAQPCLTPKEMDDIYQLPFTRKEHPKFPNVPAWKMIKDSITIVRGCSGNCSFCAIARHQGPKITSRSNSSILKEIKNLTTLDFFSGTVSDLGGPTANLFATHCKIGGCKKYDCLFPKVCKNLEVNEKLFISLLDQVKKIPGVKHLHISSGLRMELLRKTPELLKRIIRDHSPGSLKIAPEHTADQVLQLMHKEPHKELVAFCESCRKVAKEGNFNTIINPYLISAHPGCTVAHTREMATKIKELKLTVRGFQDFTPTPGTLSTAMYVSGLDTKGNKIHIPKGTERIRQRKILEDLLLQKVKRNDKGKGYRKKK